MSQLEIQEKKPVKICGFKQNCYRVATTGGIVGIAKNPSSTVKKFDSLEKVNLPTGFVQQLVEKDYPINSASVTSYAEGADYRNDPMQAIANAPKRVNLGDITEAQQFLENPQELMRMYDTVKAKLDAYYASQIQSASAKPAVSQETVETQGGEK